MNGCTARNTQSTMKTHKVKYLLERKNVCVLTSSESEEVLLSFDGPVFFRLILSANHCVLFAQNTAKEEKKTNSK